MPTPMVSLLGKDGQMQRYRRRRTVVRPLFEANDASYRVFSALARLANANVHHVTAGIR